MKHASVWLTVQGGGKRRAGVVGKSDRASKVSRPMPQRPVAGVSAGMGAAEGVCARKRLL
jgi:hypothetical protein